MMQTNKFYDVHFHAMDLSHANITAFTNRFINNKQLVKEALKKLIPVKLKIGGSLAMPLIGPFVPYSCLAKYLIKYIKQEQKIRNLLSFMETSVMYDFLIVEYFLKNEHQGIKPVVSSDNSFNVGGQNYNKIVLCPLIMDFGYPNIKNTNYYYNVPPQKPVVDQISDLFKSIHTYYTHNVIIKKGYNSIVEFDVKKSGIPKSNKLFEIYPFMGINTVNYSIEKIEKMIEKYFSDFSGSDSKKERQVKLYKAMGEFNGDLSKTKACKNIFAGIKLYPPLGFNPWPAKGKERDKVVYLYEQCIEKNIPVITHCSTGGFIAEPDHKTFANPNTQWNKVLLQERFQQLKIDFAHIGDGEEKWRNKIWEFAADNNLNVYADFSYNGCKPEYYQKLSNQLKDLGKPEVENKVMYGSDFMINLLGIKSLNEYMQYFIETGDLTNEQKTKFANTNPEAFLFGE